MLVAFSTLKDGCSSLDVEPFSKTKFRNFVWKDTERTSLSPSLQSLRPSLKKTYIYFVCDHCKIRVRALLRGQPDLGNLNQLLLAEPGSRLRPRPQERDRHEVPSAQSRIRVQEDESFREYVTLRSSIGAFADAHDLHIDGAHLCSFIADVPSNRNLQRFRLPLA